MTYVISDIHGCYDEFMELLQKIKFSPDDTLYVLGDAIDRGKDSIKCLKHIMDASNIHQLMGNHEQMMLDALTDIISSSSPSMHNWLGNGGTEVLPVFINLSKEEQLAILEYIAGLPYLAQVKIGEQNYVLVHAGLNIVDISKKIEISTANAIPMQRLNDLVWIRKRFYNKKALPRSITIFGHTPIPTINKKNIGSIWRDDRHKDKIGIDGGCVFGGNLLALRLDDMAEFAVSKHTSA